MLQAIIRAELIQPLTAKVCAQVTCTAQETYDGAYIVEPDFTGQTLETHGKVMADDVTVEPIAISRVSNPQGGRTIFIGGITNG